jgi:hypothetical protein
MVVLLARDSEGAETGGGERVADRADRERDVLNWRDACAASPKISATGA